MIYTSFIFVADRHRRGNKVKNLLMASTNAGKLKEMRQLVADLPIRVVSLADAGLAHMDVEETGETFEGKGLLKSRASCVASGGSTLADHSRMPVDAH